MRQNLGDYRGTFGAMEAEQSVLEIDRQERLGAGIPALSVEATALLDRLDDAARDGQKAFGAALEEARRREPGSLKRIEAFEAAARQRLGHLGRFLAGRDDRAPGEVAKADRVRLAPHFPKLRQIERVNESRHQKQQLEQSRDLGLRL